MPKLSWTASNSKSLNLKKISVSGRNGWRMWNSRIWILIPQFLQVWTAWQVVGIASKKKLTFVAKDTLYTTVPVVFNVGSDNSSAFDHSTSDGNGAWDIIVGHTGQPTLVLKYNNGEVISYTLTYEDSKLYLDGTRYFRTTQGEYAPSCQWFKMGRGKAEVGEDIRSLAFAMNMANFGYLCTRHALRTSHLSLPSP